MVQSALRNPIIAYDLILNRGLIMWLNGLIISLSTAAEAHQLLLVVETLWNTLFAHLLRKRNAQEKSEVEAVAELEREVEVIENDDQTEKNVAQINDKKKPVDNASSRKPIWDLLPQDQQILPPWLLFELMQLLLSLWRSLAHSEIDWLSFEVYTRIISSAGQHLHESKSRIHTAAEKMDNSLVFVAPSAILSTRFVKELLDVAPRFLNDLPDLKEHLNCLTSTVKVDQDVNDLSCPAKLTDAWVKLYERMSKLQNRSVDDLSIRKNLHMLLSLAECGV